MPLRRLKFCYTFQFGFLNLGHCKHEININWKEHVNYYIRYILGCQIKAPVLRDPHWTGMT